MRLELTATGVARATLSMRNAATLLHHLDAVGPRRWVESNDVVLDGTACWERLFMIRCHEDDAPAANGRHGRLVTWHEGGTLVLDCARSLLRELVARAAEAAPDAMRAGNLELRVESDEKHYAQRLAAPGRVAEETEQHLAAVYGRAVREPVRLGDVTTILFQRP
jgi:hypothetical protein